MKQLIATVFLLLLMGNISAQKEVFFSNLNGEKAKVETLRGFEVSTFLNPLSTLDNIFSGNNRYHDIPLQIAYFHEKSIAASWTLISSIGLNNQFSISPRYIVVTNVDNQYYQPMSIGKRLYYSMDLNLGIEPRWYFGFQKRSSWKHVLLNSGWYLSLPVRASTNLFHSHIPVYGQDRLPNWFAVTASIMPTIGYRHAVSKQWFIEGDLGIGSYYNFSNYNHVITVWKTLPKSSLSIKAAYTFKK